MTLVAESQSNYTGAAIRKWSNYFKPVVLSTSRGITSLPVNPLTMRGGCAAVPDNQRGFLGPRQAPVLGRLTSASE